MSDVTSKITPLTPGKFLVTLEGGPEGPVMFSATSDQLVSLAASAQTVISLAKQ
jgi:hypothetical protein